MINISNIDIPESVVPLMNDQVLSSITRDVAASGKDKWIKLASEDSSSFREDYVRGIQEVEPRGATGHVISLVGEIPHQLEDGSPRMDMRDTLLGPNVPVAPVGERGKHLSKEKQFYRAIPLRHTTPGSQKTIGQAMGSPYSGHQAVSDAKKLGNAVYRAAKKLEGTKTDPYGGKTQWGGRLDTSRLRGGLKKGISGIPLLKPHHKSDIYKGMVRTQKTYEKATQSMYVTFRTISTGVRDESWWRKSIPARHYADRVGEFVSRILPRAIEAYIEGQA